MTSLHQLADVQVLLLAAQLISDVNVDSLRILAVERSDILTESIIYRLLLTLFPADETARSALLTLLRSIRSNFDDVSTLDGPVDVSAVTNLSLDAAAAEAQYLHLKPLPGVPTYPEASLFSRFLIFWSHHLESAGGSLDVAVSLVQEFEAADESLSRWAQTYLLPVYRLKYEYYPDEDDNITLQELQGLSGVEGVKALLQKAEKRLPHGGVARDLEYVVAPWVMGSSDTNRTASWSDIYSWILATSKRDFKLSAEAFLTWNGPPEEAGARRETLAQLGFAIVYAGEDGATEVSQALQDIWTRSTALAGLATVDLGVENPAVRDVIAQLAKVSDINSLDGNLLSDSNELTSVTATSSGFLAGLLKTKDILSRYKLDQSVSSIAKICLNAPAERQKYELDAILQQIPRLTSSEPNWHKVGRDLHWLRSWQPPSQATRKNNSFVGFLGRVSPEVIDSRLLESILANGQYQAVKDMYLSSPETSLERSEIENQIVGAIYAAYDNASNGNRNRGGVKKASDILNAFKSFFPQSAELQAIEHLLKATHRLSFYQLVLQHGVPFRPVNIRAHKDPLCLIEKVLEQDPFAYSKLDDLVEIGRELVVSRSTTITNGDGKPASLKVIEAEQHVTFLAISSALSNHDFNTAYSYITTRLLTMRKSQVPQVFTDNVSWRAAYAAGRYRPPMSPTALSDQIANLSKRMELLSLALTLAPNAEPLSEILGTWRRCEEEMEVLKSTALKEERAFDKGSGKELPGGFGFDERELDAAETRQALSRRNLAGGNASYEEEAPMGLFEMAKGAASLVRKNAFPLNTAAGGRDIKIQPRISQDSDDRSGLANDGERIRKRDMVSNMVTSGLVSGMGWVLGAQPAQRPGQQQQ